MNIKAIETTYRGWKFRSRLEARYAVFFDALGIEYEYEMEGYELSSGWYLPDFWLPSFKMYFEVKPPGGECYHAEAMLAGDKPIIVANGSPMKGSLEVHCWHYGYSGGGSGLLPGQFAINRNGHTVINVSTADHAFFGDTASNVPLPFLTNEKLPSSMILLRAAEQARAARFDKTDRIVTPKDLAE